MYGAAAPVRSQSQRSTVTSLTCATASSTSLVFPMPGSPTTSIRPPDPLINCSAASCKMAISRVPADEESSLSLLLARLKRFAERDDWHRLAFALKARHRRIIDRV